MFLPLLMREAEGSNAGSGQTSGNVHDLVAGLQRFLTYISHAKQQLQGATAEKTPEPVLQEAHYLLGYLSLQVSDN